MAQGISDETIEYLAALSKLSLSHEERERARQDVGELLACADKLKELDTKGVKPLFEAYPSRNVFREDVVTNGDGGRDALANAPQEQDGGFVVPKTIS